MGCEYRIWREGRLRECGRRVGVHVWYDSRGDLHSACGPHIAERLHRFPEADPPEPKWDIPDPIDEYKSYTDAGWTESELAAAFGR